MFVVGTLSDLSAVHRFWPLPTGSDGMATNAGFRGQHVRSLVWSKMSGRVAVQSR